MRSLLSLATLLLLLASVSATRDRRKAAKLAGYGAPPVYHTTTTPAPVDLHGNKEFCVDVSAYQPVKWVELEDEECDTVFVKRCGERKENVCADVVETKCEVIPYTECSMGMVPQPLNRTKLAPKLFVEKTCEQVFLTIEEECNDYN